MAFSTLGIAAIGEQLASRRQSVSELVEECLIEIRRQERLNAFITVTDAAARQRARGLDAVPRGKRGPLHGVPYAAKDVIATRGIRTTNGSRVTADWVPTADAAVITRLDAAGAVLVGKLNLWEFAMVGTSLAGDILNPWSTDHAPAGSSGGSGAAVAAGLVPFSLGTDTGGSIRMPAASCGVAGLRPTFGRVSCEGITVNAWSVDTVGPLARSVDDVARVFAVLADPPPAGRPARQRSVRGLRVGLPRNYFFEDMTPGVERAVTAALDEFKRLGMELVDVDIAHGDLAGELRTLHLAEAAQYHEQRLRERGDLLGPALRARLEDAKHYLATDYIKALRARTLLQNEVDAVFSRCDLFVTPTDVFGPARVAPDPQTSSAPRRNRGNTALASMTGIPALAMPCGIIEGPPALPVSLQLHGRPFDEALLFQVGMAYQKVTSWHLKTHGS
jgi:aspartyl-tRNA(Asn)/glutamyl-tRNA(Gln) amidotransferase subunit A